MEISDSEIIGRVMSFIFLIMGLGFIIFHKPIGEFTVEFNAVFLGYKRTASYVRMCQVAFLLAGIAFVVAGALALFGFVRFV